MRLTGVVSEAVADLVHGPVRQGRVVAGTRLALYVTTGDPGRPAVALIHPDAVRVPNGILLPGAVPPRPRPGTPVVIGAGRVTVGPWCVRAEGSWAPPRAQGLLTGPVRADRCAELAHAAGPGGPELAGLRAALRADDPERIVGAGRALVGRGPGLTPSGDDVLCGALLARHAMGRPTGALAAAVRDAEARTPLVSAALLRHAVRGECIPQLACVLADVTSPSMLDARPLLAVGHHSGADLARGVVMGLAAVVSTCDCADRI